MPEYAHPEALVTTDWVKEHLDDPAVRLVEVDVDTKAYEAGHIPGSVGFNWQTQLQDQTNRDIVSKEGLERLLGKAGVLPSHTVVVYGDHNNWFAAYFFWVLKIYGHEDVRMMDGGRNKWLAEDDKPLTIETPTPTPSTYTAQAPDASLRARAADVLATVDDATHNLIDVRSPDEFTGKVIAPAGMSETAQRGGHVPGAANVPWSSAINEDGTFKPLNELIEIYRGAAGLENDRDTITYCRIGERSSHTWFVLRYLLGARNVRNYDGSWTEYGSMIGVPIAKD